MDKQTVKKISVGPFGWYEPGQGDPQSALSTTTNESYRRPFGSLLVWGAKPGKSHRLTTHSVRAPNQALTLV
jgi:hypothetical protein